MLYVSSSTLYSLLQTSVLGTMKPTYAWCLSHMLFVQWWLRPPALSSMVGQAHPLYVLARIEVLRYLWGTALRTSMSNYTHTLKSIQIIEAKSAVDKERRLKMEFDTDSFDILIDNCCSHTLTNDINDYIEPPIKSSVRVRGYNGSTNSTMVGTVKWKIKDDKGKIHNFILPNTYYSSSVETRLLSPQHWEQTRKKGRDSCCFTYHDAIIMRWNKDKYQITVPLDNRKHRNMGVVRSADIKQSLTSCQAIYQEFTTLAYPTTICMDYQAAEVTDDEASVEAPKASQSKSEKTMDEVRPVMPTETSTKLALSIPFDGDPSNVHRFKMDFVDHLKNV
jgi:hypothetical protein